MKITVDKDKCLGCNLCNDVSSGSLGIEFDTDGKAAINPAADLTKNEVIEALKLSAEVCPMQAISVGEN